MDSNKIYESLALHLDGLPAGFPRTESGVEIRILKRLFTPEEAELAQLVTLRPETASTIATRLGRDPEELASKLEALSRKGLIYRMNLRDKTLYMAAQFIIGIWEFHVNDLDPQLIKDVGEYLPHYFGQRQNLTTPQLRTIPITRAILPQQAIMPYEEARRIILEQEKIVVAPCICRREHKIMEKGCDRPMESCLVFGNGARYYEENGLGRPIEQIEALNILDQAEKYGLVLQPSNTQKVTNICTCCGCCCQILKNLKNLPNPAKHAASNFFAAVDPELCIGCATCTGRCQMDAIDLSGDAASIKLENCIGCALCVPTCPTGAMSLKVKPEEERSVPPSDQIEKFKLMASQKIALLKDVEDSEK